MSRSTVLLVLLVAGCARAPADVPAPLADAPPPAPTAPKEKDNWRAQYGLPDEIDPRKLTFEKPEVGEAFLKVDAAARKVAGADWAKRAGDRYPYYTWNSSGTPGSFNQSYRGAWEKVANPERGPAARPNHTVHLSTTIYTGKPTETHGFELWVSNDPKTGWRANFDYSISTRKDGTFESFHLTFRHDDHTPALLDPNVRAGLMFGPGRTYLTVARTARTEMYAYRFYVSSLPGGAPGFAKGPIGREVARYWVSADSFREVALEELDKLEANAKDGIASGKRAEISTHGGPTGADVPQPVPNKDAGGGGPRSASVPEGVKKDALKEALAEIETRRKLVKDHYKEMHAAIVAALPGFGEIVSPKK